jgi:uncharacterized protein YkuJ
MKVIFIPEVRLYIQDLEYKLYLNHYFGSKESAHEYADWLLDAIQTDLHNLTHKEATPYFDRYGEGMRYVTFRKNKHTHWYVFFNTYEVDGEVVFLVRYINNNHSIAQYL